MLVKVGGRGPPYPIVQQDQGNCIHFSILRIVLKKKMAKRFTIRSHGPCPKSSYATLDEAYKAALNFAQDSGKNVAVIEHEGDNTRLVKKVFHIS